MYSDILNLSKTEMCAQKLIYWNRDAGNDITYGIPVNYNNSCVPMLFDPWSGKWIQESYKSSYFSELYEMQEIQHKYVGMYKGTFDIMNEGPKELRGTNWLFKKFEEGQNLHSNERYCTILESHTRYGERGDTSLIEIPNIRVVAILNKVEHGGWNDENIRLFFMRNGYQELSDWEFEGWTPIDYCPFCGAKLPSRFN